jgi:threonine 3-dehydrogenase
VIFKGLNMRGIYGREMFETWYKMAALLQAGSTSRRSSRTTSRSRNSSRVRDHGIGSVGKVILDWGTLS